MHPDAVLIQIAKYGSFAPRVLWVVSRSSASQVMQKLQQSVAPTSGFQLATSLDLSACVANKMFLLIPQMVLIVVRLEQNTRVLALLPSVPEKKVIAKMDGLSSRK